MKSLSSFRFLVSAAAALLAGAAFAEKVKIANGIVSRNVECGKNILGESYHLAGDAKGVMRRGSREFSFVADGRLFSGRDEWRNVKVVRSGENAVSIAFESDDGKMSVALSYEAFPGLPVVRKSMKVTNIGDVDMKLEEVSVEDFETSLSPTESAVLRSYARDKFLGPNVGDWDDCLVMVHDHRLRRGIAVGNEAVGVMKRTALFEDGRSLRAGVSARNAPHPFRRWLKKGESWSSPAVFTAIYFNADDPHRALDEAVGAYVRRHLGARVEQIARKPVFVYNTWHPFRTRLDEKLILEVARAAAECGVEEFVIDDGWQVRTGDWEVDRRKFPNGLKPVFDEIRALGMKPGLWLSLATAKRDGRTAREHPEWAVRDESGRAVSLHDANGSIETLCMGTAWRDEIRDTILGMVRDFGLAYVKLDLAIATSAYVYDPARSGCCAKDHPFHRDREESFDVIYTRCMELFDELHAAAPELYIDCTFETAGKMHLMDYGIARHADGNWLSNIEEDAPLGSFRVRDLAWKRALALPPASLVVGNLRMDAPNRMLGFKSLAGTLPIMLGDPRRLDKAARAEYKAWASWLKGLEARHGYMSYRQDLPGFGEPAYGSWDGFARINTDTKSGGLVGVFRQGAAESSRAVAVPGLDPAARYAVRKGVTSETICEASGRELAERGFAVSLEAAFDGELFEIERL